MIRHFSPGLKRTVAERRWLALTYDDGPGPRTTPELLELFRATSTPASFFMLGKRVEAAPDLARAVAEEGHEVGSHSWGHRHAWKEPPRLISQDIRRGFDALEPYRTTPMLFRPPFGKMTPMSWLQVRRRGARLCWWTLDSGDTRPVLPTPRSISDQLARDGGGVVLMHDFDRVSSDADERRAFVLELSENLIRTAAREGIRIVSFQSIFEADR